MKWRNILVMSAVMAGTAFAAVPDIAPIGAAILTAAQIVEKNIAARGGLDAWRKIRSMVWVGHIESANDPTSQMQFVLEQQRPNKTRFDIKAQYQMSARIFDGVQGWKLRTVQGGKPDLQPYTEAELEFARDGQGIDGPLLDFAAKGVNVALGGVDVVEGRQSYRLNVSLPSGISHHVWIDAQTFLDIKYDRVSHNAMGMPSTVSVFNRDFRTIEGLLIPYTIETGTAKAADKMVIDKIVLNPALDDRVFAKPSMPRQRHAATVDTRVPPPAGGGVRPAMLVKRGLAEPAAAAKPDAKATP